jgi:hypothetical protein
MSRASVQSIRSLGAPVAGAHWSYGPDYMCRISESSARKLLHPHRLPRMGYEIDAYRDGLSGPLLTVQNISGDFYAASYNTPIDAWPDAFGVQVRQ